MGSRKISFSLGTSEGLREFRSYADNIQARIGMLTDELLSETEKEIGSRLNGALSDDKVIVTKDAEIPVPVYASASIKAHKTSRTKGFVQVQGEDIHFVEFGAGVTHNGSVGSSNNPLGANAPYPTTIGSYGQGRGSQKKWFFTEGGQKYASYGTPGRSPIYRASQRIVEQAVNIAKRVFG